MLSEKSRSSIFQNLGPIIGEEAVGQMLAHYPATEGEQPVTKDFLDARLSEHTALLRSDMSDLARGLRAEMSDLDRGLRSEMSDLRVELHQQTKQLLIWIPTAVAAISGVIAVLARLG